MTTILIICIIIVLVILLLTILTTNKAYQYEHKIDPLDKQNHHQPAKEPKEHQGEQTKSSHGGIGN